MKPTVRPVAETLAAIDRVLGEQAQHRTRLAVDRLFAHPYHDDIWAVHLDEGVAAACSGPGCGCNDVEEKVDTLFRGPFEGPRVLRMEDGSLVLVSPADRDALVYQHEVLGDHVARHFFGRALRSGELLATPDPQG